MCHNPKSGNGDYLRTAAIACFFWILSVTNCFAQTNLIGLAREYVESGRFTSAVRILELLVADSTDHIEGQLLLLRIRQDSYLRHKKKALILSRQLRGLDPSEQVVNGTSVETEIKLRHFQLTKSPRNATSFLFTSRRSAASSLLDENFGSSLGLLERALEAHFMNDESRSELFAQQALDSDPLSHPAYVKLFRYAAEREQIERMDSLATRLQKAIPESPYGWLMMGYVNAARREFESAELNFQIAMERSPRSTRHAYIDATSLIKQDVAGKAGIDSLTYSQNYWIRQDPLHLSSANERRIEHFARHTYADMMFADHYEDWPGWATDRGKFFIRYGPPDHIQREIRREDEPSFYDDRMAELTGDRRYLTQRIVRKGAAKTEFRFEYWLYDKTIWYFYDSWWTDTYILYSPPSRAFELGLIIDDEIEAHNWAFREPFRSAVTIPGAQLPLTYVASRFRREGFDGTFEESDTMDVVVARGVPVPYRPRSGSVNSPVRIGAFLTGFRNGMVARTVEEFQNREAADITEIDNTLFWRHVKTLSAPANDSYQLSVEYQTLPKEAIWGVQRENIEPLEPTSDSPGMSDLLLATTIDDAVPGLSIPLRMFKRYDLEIVPAPDSLFEIGAPLYVYFEAYDMSPDPTGLSSFSIETVLVSSVKKTGIAAFLEKLDWKNNDAAVSVLFDAEGPGSTVPYYILLDTDNLETGDYTIAIRITDKQTGRTMSRARTISLRR